MYNENQKIRFINEQRNNITKQAKERATFVFESIASYEEKANCDVCNLPPKDYAKIILSSMNCDKYQYLCERVGILMQYRLYCFNAKLTDEVKFISGGGSIEFSTKEMDLYDIYRSYKEADSFTKMIFSPNLLCKYLIKHIDVKDDTEWGYGIALNKLLIIFVMLHFYGASKDEVCNLKTSSVTIYSKENVPFAVVRLRDRSFKVYGEVYNLLLQRSQSDWIIPSFASANSNLVQEFEKGYLFLFEGDKPYENDRYQKFAMKFSNELKKASVRMPTLSQIKYAGIIYQMCEEVYQLKLPYESVDDIVNLYGSLTNSKVVNEKTQKDIYLDFNIAYKQYIKEHEES